MASRAQPLSPLARAARAILWVGGAPFRWASGHIRDGALPWLRGAVLTLLHVDAYGVFPAIQFEGRHPRLRIRKEPGAKLILHGPLLVRNTQDGRHGDSSIHLMAGARMEVEGPLHIGEQVRIQLAPRAVFVAKGAGPGVRERHGYSGFMREAIVQVKERFEMGRDTGFSWRCEVMDSDWHPLDGKLESFPVVVGDHVWVTPDAKVLKGARIGADSIVARGALVLGGDYPAKSFIAGAPATRKGTAPDWRFEWYEW